MVVPSVTTVVTVTLVVGGGGGGATVVVVVTTGGFDVDEADWLGVIDSVLVLVLVLEID